MEASDDSSDEDFTLTKRRKVSTKSKTKKRRQFKPKKRQIISSNSKSDENDGQESRTKTGPVGHSSKSVNCRDEEVTFPKLGRVSNEVPSEGRFPIEPSKHQMMLPSSSGDNENAHPQELPVRCSDAQSNGQKSHTKTGPVDNPISNKSADEEVTFPKLGRISHEGASEEQHLAKPSKHKMMLPNSSGDNKNDPLCNPPEVSVRCSEAKMMSGGGDPKQADEDSSGEESDQGDRIRVNERDPPKLHNPRKLAPFSREEEQKIVDYIVENNHEGEIGGTILWKLIK